MRTRTRIYTDDPKSTIDAIRLLLMWFGGEDRVKCVPWRAIRRGCRVLKLIAHLENDGTVGWSRNPKEWKGRLVLAGIDPETLEVVDQERWDMMWEQLIRTGTFRDDVQKRWIALGHESPRAEPITRAKVLGVDGNVRRQKKEELNTVLDYMSREQRRRFKRGK